LRASFPSFVFVVKSIATVYVTRMVTVRFLGSGDAFGSGGRFNTCIAVVHGGGALLLDCGVSSLVAMRRTGFDPSTIDVIALSHLHGDHFGGVPFVVLDAQFANRTRPLTIVGPPGTGARVRELMEAMFPGSWASRKRFALDIVEYGATATALDDGVALVAHPVVHTPGSSPHALRLAVDGRNIAYSGDTEWTDALLAVADGADLFVCEAYYFDKRVPYHLDLQSLSAHRGQLRCKRLVLTHMSHDILSRVEEARAAGFELADDGLAIDL
jgi:ribonuclease BN (tRNA processing enzyme)